MPVVRVWSELPTALVHGFVAPLDPRAAAPVFDHVGQGGGRWSDVAAAIEHQDAPASRVGGVGNEQMVGPAGPDIGNRALHAMLAVG